MMSVFTIYGLRYQVAMFCWVLRHAFVFTPTCDAGGIRDKGGGAVWRRKVGSSTEKYSKISSFVYFHSAQFFKGKSLRQHCFYCFVTSLLQKKKILGILKSSSFFFLVFFVVEKMHWPPLCRCWRDGLSCRNKGWWFYSNYPAPPCLLLDLMKCTHSSSSHRSRYCHNTWTENVTQCQKSPNLFVMTKAVFRVSFIWREWFLWGTGSGLFPSQVWNNGCK